LLNYLLTGSHTNNIWMQYRVNLIVFAECCVCRYISSEGSCDWWRSLSVGRVRRCYQRGRSTLVCFDDKTVGCRHFLVFFQPPLIPLRMLQF